MTQEKLEESQKNYQDYIESSNTEVQEFRLKITQLELDNRKLKRALDDTKVIRLHIFSLTSLAHFL